MTMTGPSQSTPGPRSLYSGGRAGLIAMVVMGWAKALITAAAAVLIGAIVDRAGTGGPTGVLLVWLLALFTLRAALAAIPPLLAQSTSHRVERDLRARVLECVLRLGPSPERRTGETVTKATEGVVAVGALAGTFLPQLISGMSIPLLLAVVVAFVDWPTALVLLVSLPLVPLLLRLLEKRFASVTMRYRARADQLAARFFDGVQGLRTLKALDRADSYGDEIASEAERLRVETMGLLRINQLALLAVDSLFTLGTVVAAAAMAGWRLSAGAITMGEAVSIVLLGVMLIEPLGQIGRYFYVGAIGRAAVGQIEALLEAAPSSRTIGHDAGSIETGCVSVDRVGFAYRDGTRVIEDLSFRIAPGERVALVGPSGAGKTTIAHLVLGLLQPDRGAVRVGGRVVLVPQRPFLFHGTVADNLRLASPAAHEAEMWTALERADLADMVAGRSQGLETPVGERGLRLSGGEVQRLAIARALIADAPVVVLDEPTSNIDLDSEARINASLHRLAAGRTLLMIAHRRSTIAGVDRVLVVDRGGIVAELAGTEAGGALEAMGSPRSDE